MDRLKETAQALAQAFLAGEATVAGLRQTALWVLGEPWPWIPALCRHLKRRMGEHFYDFSVAELAVFIAAYPAYIRAFSLRGPKPRVLRYSLELPRRSPKADWLARINLPLFNALGDLAQWLNLTPSELDWFADRWRPDLRQAEALRHYRYCRLEKRSGGYRLLEIPKSRLRNIQTKLLRSILNPLPPHPAAHGFRRSHSCLSHARLHCGKAVVIRMDLQDFFPSIPAGRVTALFAKLAYPAPVAAVLGRLCTHPTPSHIAEAVVGPRDTQWRVRHLPQGAPTSPALANLCAYRLDLRLQGLASAMGADYSRYADDLVFSGDATLRRSWYRFATQVGAIALEEGFRVNHRKTRMTPASQRQQITGIVVNQHPNIARKDFDQLKAILCNCLRHGPASQNRNGHADFRAYLMGKIAYVNMVNPARGAKLMALATKIDWERCCSISRPSNVNCRDG